MLGCLRVLQGAATAAPPTRLDERLYLSGAVEAASLHLLRRLGVTHVLNATEARPLIPFTSVGLSVLHSDLSALVPRA